MFMRTITYEQIWNRDAFIADMDMVSRAIFAEREEIQWLVGNGHMPEMLQFDLIDQDQRHYLMIFRVPDSVLTYLMLLFPEAEHRIEF